MATGKCARCGNPLRADAVFCPKCGLPAAASFPAAGGASLRGELGYRRLFYITFAVVVALVVTLVFQFGFYLPTHTVVTMDGGTWIVNGAASSLGVEVGCSNCGQVPVAGSTFTVDVNVEVNSASCGPFGCPGYSVGSFSVDSPYVLDQVSPSNLPYTESAGSFNTWALTVTAPPTGGHYPLDGAVAVSYV